MFKKIPVVILIIILYLFSFFVVPSFAINDYTSINKFYFTFSNEGYILPILIDNDYYNSSSDLLMFCYEERFENKFVMFVLHDCKSYSNIDYKICRVSGWKGFIPVIYDSSTGNEVLRPSFSKFVYDGINWTLNQSVCTDTTDYWSNGTIGIKCNFDLYLSFSSTSPVLISSSFDNLPFIANTTEQLENVSVGELAIGDNGFAPSLLDITLRNNTISSTLFTINLTDYADYISRLDLSDPFSNFGYVIPWKDLPQFSFIENNQYTIYIDFGELMTISKTFIVRKSISSTDIPLTNVPEPSITPTPDPNQSIIDSNKETQNKLDEQTNAIKEQTETNKNIFQKIGDILDLLNPFSDNFFGKKLVELILNGIKSLFVPEDGFFSNYFNEIKEWFSDRLGFLWSPFDFLIELLTRISNINFNEPKFNIPDIYEPFTNNKIISTTEFNFNDFLDNSILKIAHDIYLLLVDGFIIFSLYKLISAKIEEVFTK